MMAFSAGIILTCLGDIGMWASHYGYLPWPWTSLAWYLWLPAASCFALAPACQLQALHRATARQTGAGIITAP